MIDLLLAEKHYQQACDHYTDVHAALQTRMLDFR
jgi:hypothetical protein